MQSPNDSYSTRGVVLASLALLLVVYVTSYALALRPVEITFDLTIGDGQTDEVPNEIPWRRDAYYFSTAFPRSSSCEIGAVVFWPLNYRDQQCRPDYWATKECREFEAFVATLPVNAAGQPILTLGGGIGATDTGRPMLDRLRKVADRIGEKLFWTVAVHDFRAGHCVGLVAQVRSMMLGKSATEDIHPRPESPVELAGDRPFDVRPWSLFRWKNFYPSQRTFFQPPASHLACRKKCSAQGE